MAEIDRILRETITDPVGPEFMACRHAASPREARPALTWSRAEKLVLAPIQMSRVLERISLPARIERLTANLIGLLCRAASFR
jgi:hypothetical protein